jgi:hypothetical protein
MNLKACGKTGFRPNFMHYFDISLEGNEEYHEYPVNTVGAKAEIRTKHFTNKSQKLYYHLTYLAHNYYYCY